MVLSRYCACGVRSNALSGDQAENGASPANRRMFACPTAKAVLDVTPGNPEKARFSQP